MDDERLFGSSDGENIVNTSSISAVAGTPMEVLYCTSKGACHMFTRAIATEFRDQGIRCNAVCPGFIKTAIFNRVKKKDPNRFKKILSRTPLNRFGKVEDISDVVGFLCSPESKFITGSVIPVDGGFHSSF